MYFNHTPTVIQVLSFSFHPLQAEAQYEKCSTNMTEIIKPDFVHGVYLQTSVSLYLLSSSSSLIKM